MAMVTAAASVAAGAAAGVAVECRINRRDYRRTNMVYRQRSSPQRRRHTAIVAQLQETASVLSILHMNM
jgi:hypothetical protein